MANKLNNTTLNTEIFQRGNAFQTELSDLNESKLKAHASSAPNDSLTIQFEQKRRQEAKELSEFIRALEQQIPGDKTLQKPSEEEPNTLKLK